MLIEAIDVSRNYISGKNEVAALENVSFHIDNGEFVSVTGASGSGKSTLMNIIGMLDIADSGEYRFENKNVCELSEREISRIRNEKIGFVFQSFNLIPTLTTLENVCLPLEYRGVSKKQRIERARNALCLVGLEHRIFHKPTELSGGQQQRAAIARAIAADPQLILADEPCGNLDSRAGAEIMKLLHNLNENGKTVVMITHDNAAAKLADRIIRVRDGKIIS